MRITFLESAINPVPIGHGTFKQLITKMLQPDTVAEGKELARLAREDSAGYDAAKRRLPAFMIGEFSKRNEESCTLFEPYICFDIDHIPLEGMSEMMDGLAAWEYTVIVYPSPSGKGFRLIAQVECDISSRSRMYDYAAELLSVHSKLPLEQDLSLADRKVLPVINTSTKDLPRLWYYTGISEYRVNRSAKVVQAPMQAPARAPMVGYGSSEETKVEAVVQAIEQKGVDLTADYDSWVRAGMSLASEFGESGRDWYHRISSFHSDYDSRKTDKKYDNILKTNRGGISIATFFKFAKDAGIEIIPDHRQYDHLSPGAKYEDVDLEKSINSFLVRHRHRYDELVTNFPSLSELCFRDQVQRSIFSAVKKMAEKGTFIDQMAVKAMVGEEAMLTIDKTKDPGAEAATGYAGIIYDLYRRSELQVLFAKAASEIMLEEADVDEKLASMDSSIASVQAVGFDDDDTIASAVLASRSHREQTMLRLVGDPNAISGITTGLVAEDAITGGRQRGTLNIVAARPGMGKTAKMLCEARSSAISGFPVGIFSIEMTSKEIAKRLTAQQGRFSNKKLKNPTLLDFERLEHELVERTEYEISQMPIWIDDKSRTLKGIISKARYWKRKYGIQEIFIDYLGLIRLEGKGNRALELGDASRDLKGLAKELDIPVIALHQLSRAVETRGGSKRPMLSDLKDSGGVEENADTVSFIYRPEYYKITEDEYGLSTVGLAEVIYGKNRDGDLDTVKSFFEGDFFLFSEWTRPEVKVPDLPVLANNFAGDGDGGFNYF